MSQLAGLDLRKAFTKRANRSHLLEYLEEAERRALVLSNPGLGGKPYMTNTLFGDVQLSGPREAAHAHRHTTSASRFFIEGSGSYSERVPRLRQVLS